MSTGEIIRTFETGKGGFKYGICPYCGNGVKTMSADPETDTFFCYACGRGGRLGRLLRRTMVPYVHPGRRKRAAVAGPLKKMHKEAMVIYKELLGSKQGKNAKAYIKSRGYKVDEINKFDFGYAGEGDILLEKFKNKYPEWMLKKSGLFSVYTDGTMHDLFRDRLMIPIKDEEGEIIAFGGRTIGDKNPKYLNTPETEIFSKRETLFGLSPKERQKGDTVLICEGYMDCLAVKRIGYSECVATLGTALTEEHMLKIASRYRKAYISFDSDEAGTAAAKRAIVPLLDMGMQLNIPSYLPFKDPDELISKKGKPEFYKRLILAEKADAFMARNATPEELVIMLAEKTKV